MAENSGDRSIRLLALEGAIQGVKKTRLSDAVKADLKAFYQEHRL